MPVLNFGHILVQQYNQKVTQVAMNMNVMY